MQGVNGWQGLPAILEVYEVSICGGDCEFARVVACGELCRRTPQAASHACLGTSVTKKG